ncbi:MAG TPA: hypothetical protein VMS10_01775 [Methyloceanibacter sp.]|jgi:hypothetical protein|nr:hypothetical protein [Methyloceanibacter sp.]
MLAIPSDVELPLRLGAPASVHVQFEDARNHKHALRPVSVLEHRKAERFGPIDKNSAAEAALILHHPVPLPVLAEQKERRSRTRGFGLSHRRFLCYFVAENLLLPA